MIYRKTWFSYVLWVVYTMLCAIFLVFAGQYVCVSYFSDGAVQEGLALPGALGFAAVPMAAAVYWLIRLLSGRFWKRYAGKEFSGRILEGIVVCALFALGAFLRMERTMEYIRLQDAAQNGMQSFLNGMDYFDMAAVTAGGPSEPAAFGSARLYVACLSVVLSFLGNKAASAIVFQAFLQIVGLVLGYAVARKSAGRLPACAVLLYLACSPGYLEMLKNLGPECLFFDLYLVVMLATVSFLKAYCGNRCKRAAALAGAAVVGALTGILGYLDLTAFTVLVLAAAIFTGKKSRTKEQPVNNSIRTGIAAAMVMLTACAAAFLGMTAAVSFDRGTEFVLQLEEWAALHVWNTRTFGFRPLYPYSLDMILFSVLTVMASFLVFEFFRSGREQNYMLWILLCIVAAPTPLAVFGEQPFGLVSMYLWGVLAGLGLQNCMFGGRTRLMKTMIEEINQAAEEAEAAEEIEKKQVPDLTEAAGGRQAPDPAEESEEKRVSELAEETEKKRVPDLAEEPEEKQVPELAEESGKKQASNVTEESEEKQVSELAEESGKKQASNVTEAPEEKQVSDPAEESGECHRKEPALDHAAQEKPARKPRYIENPLPLPKKHVRRQMDYQYSVDDKNMKFDVEVSDDDDFDL